MILNKDYLFVHVPKTGGTSISFMLNEYSRGRCEDFGGQHDIVFMAYKQMADMDFTKRFKFGFVRNPFDREVSNYFFHAVANNQLSISFEDWVKWRYDEMYDSVSIIQFPDRDTYYYNKGFAKTPQIGFFVDNKGNNLMDFIGRFETIEQDWATVAEKLGMPTVVLPRDNVSHDRDSVDYRKYYTPEVVDIITKAHALDLQIFNYDFEHGMTSRDINKDVEIKIHLSGAYNYYYG